MSEPSDCPREKTLIDFATQALNPEQHASVSSHMEECQPCCDAVEWIKCHLLRPIDDDESDLTGIGIHPPGEVPDEEIRSDESTSQMVDFDFSVLEKSHFEGAIGRLGKYDLLGIIGKGGMGIVFKAWDEQLRRTVAIKVLKRSLASSDTSRRRFLREGRSAAAISHVNVVTIHAVDEHRGVPFLVMEFINGHSLRTAIRDKARLEFPTVLRLSAQIASGLAAAHSHGVIHRDIKPGNIMLEETVDRAKITDFGLARAYVEGNDHTTGDLAVGTPAYMAPEQILGESVDYRSDLFGLGCLFHEMVAGRSPFQGKSPLAVARNVESLTPQPLHVLQPQIPRFYSDLVTKLLEKDPERRYQSAAQVAELLARQLQNLNAPESDTIQPPLPAARRGERVSRRWSLATWTIAAPILLGVIATLLLLTDPFMPANAARTASNPGTTPTIPASLIRVLPKPRPGYHRIEVSKSHPSAVSTLAVALERIQGPGVIEILDSEVYEEHLLIDDQRWEGLTIRSPQGAVLRSAAPDTLLTIDSVENVTIDGLSLETHSQQHAVEIRGLCPGTRLTQVAVKSPKSSQRAAIYLHAEAAGTEHQPLIIENCRVHANSGMAVTGDPSLPSGWLLVRQNRFQGHGANRDGVGVVLHAEVREVTIENNTFFALRRAVSLAPGAGQALAEIRVRQNSIYQCGDWLAVQPAKLHPVNIAIHGNLIADVPSFELPDQALQGDWGKWIFDNRWESNNDGSPRDPQRASAVAALCDHVRFRSRDPAEPGFLKPLPPPETGAAAQQARLSRD